MSGEYFQGKEHIIGDIIDRIEQTQAEVNKKLSLGDLMSEEYHLANYVEDKEGFNLICNTAKFYLEMAYTLSHRISYFMSGDDGEESFHQRTIEDVDKVLEKHKEIIEVLK